MSTAASAPDSEISSETNYSDYVTRSTDADLSAPLSDEILDECEIELVSDCYQSLQYSLFETGHPQTEDRTKQPRDEHNPAGVTVAVLSTPQIVLGLMLEGGKALPGCFHLILTKSWISKRTNEEGLDDVYVHKAITFGSHGRSYIDVYQKPRKVTYLHNHFIDTATSGVRGSSEIERNIACPLSSSVKLCRRIDDKVYTRVLMTTRGVEVPFTVAFRYRPTSVIHPVTKVRIVDVFEKDSAQIGDELAAFLEQFQRDRKMIVKPSGPRFYGSAGVSIHRRADGRTIADAVHTLLDDLQDDESVLVEYVEHLLPRTNENSHEWSAKPENQLGFRTRATVFRDSDDSPTCSPIVCGIASANDAINGDNTFPLPLDTCLLMFGVKDQIERDEIADEIRHKSEITLQAIIDEENKMTPEERGPVRSQTALIGIDFIITDCDGKLVPVSIEVNSHDCLLTNQSYDFIHNNPAFLATETAPTALCTSRKASSSCRFIENGLTACTRPLVRTMIRRSQDRNMEGKRLLVIGGGPESKPKIFRDMKLRRIQIILVDPDASHEAIPLVWHFVRYDYHEHSRDVEHADNIVKLVAQLDVDGCLTFLEDNAPLTANIVQKMKLRGCTVAASVTANIKSRTMNTLMDKKGCGLPHYPDVTLYATRAQTFPDGLDMDIINRLKYPLMMELEHGSSAGARLVQNSQQLSQHFAMFTKNLRGESNFPGNGLGSDNSVMVTTYHGGSGHGVDVVLYDRQLLAAFVTDNGPTRSHTFTETSATLPSVLPAPLQRALKTAAYQCCVALGFTDGVFNVEMKLLPSGPKLIKVNGQMGGFYIRDWIQAIYDADLAVIAAEIACGLRPYIPLRTPTRHLMGIMLLPSLHAHILDKVNLATLKSMEERNEIIITIFGSVHSQQFLGVEEPIDNLAAFGNSAEEARIKLLQLCRQFDISANDYDVQNMIRFFQ